MSLINRIPPGSNPIQTQTIYTATFNVPTLGKYDFSIPANQKLLIHPGNRSSVYFLDRMNFSCDISEADFKFALDVPITLSLKSSKSNSQKTPTAIPFINYVDNTEYQYFYTLPEDGENLTGTLTGSLVQTAPLIGRVTIRALVQLNVYEITNKFWIENYSAPKTREQGSEYSLR